MTDEFAKLTDEFAKLVGNTLDERIAPFFVLRVPAMPYAFLDSLRDEFAASKCFEHSIESNNDQVSEAIFLASSALYKSYFEDAARNPSIIHSMARYLFRMSARSTPYGAFAAVGVGLFQSQTRLEITQPRLARRFVRLDQGVVEMALTRYWNAGEFSPADDEVIVVNSSLWRAPDGWRFVETKRSSKGTHYEQSRIRPTPEIDSVVDYVSKAPRSVREIVRKVFSDAQFSSDEIREFIAKLLKNQLLVMLPQIPVTGDNTDNTDSVVQYLQSHRRNDTVAQAFIEAQSVIKDLGKRHSPISPEQYMSAAKPLLDVNIEIDEAKLAQVDLHIDNGTISIASSIVNKIVTSIEQATALLAPPYNPLGSFAEQFTSRYGDQLVPLLELLDDDFGLGFGGRTRVPTPLLRGVRTTPRRTDPIDFDEKDAFKLDQVVEAARAGQSEVVLDEVKLAKFGRSSVFPDDVTLLGSLLASKDPADFDLNRIVGPPMGSMLGRFASGNPRLTELMRAVQNDVGDDGTIIAEIVHLPEGRAGNVILRPVFSQYEIAYLGASGLKQEDVILAQDLSVYVKDGVVRLWCARLESHILPRLSSAHNFNHPLNLPVYRFLGNLQRQSLKSHGWTWGGVASAPWLPGVRVGNVRLSRERWTISPEEVAQLKTDANSIDRLVHNRSLPEGIRIVEGDNFLDINLVHELDRQLFLDAARRSASMTVERSSELSDLVLDEQGRNFGNELVIPIPKRATHNRISAPPNYKRKERTAHEWIYIQIFGGHMGLEKWLTEEFPHLVDLADQLEITRAFFIRYDERGNHVRFRAFGRRGGVWGRFRSRLESGLKKLSKGGFISHWEYHPYVPELRRYGGTEMMAVCERIFAADSIAAVDALRSIDLNGDRESARWKFALQSMLSLLRVLSQSTEQAMEIGKSLLDKYVREFGLDVNDLDLKYRAKRQEVDNLIAAIADERYAQILRRRAVTIKQALRSSSIPLPERTIHSLLHMCANRIFPEQARLHEPVLLHFGLKAIRSLQVRNISITLFQINVDGELH